MNTTNLLFLIILLAFTGCGINTQSKVVLYCGQDRQYAETIVADFTKATGVEVIFQTDTEANKAVGLYQILVREKDAPRADVFWGNEPLLLERLATQGILAKYESPAASKFPESSRPAHRKWQGFAARSRILLVNPKVAKSDYPMTMVDLTNPKWKKKLAMAKPYFGSTATHMVHLYSELGPEVAKKYFQELAEVATLLPGNSDVAKEVAAGRFDIGLTDTDDAKEQLAKNPNLVIVYLDNFGKGPLFYPNTLGLIQNAPHSKEGKQLIDYLLDSKIEARLATGPSGQYPLNPEVKVDMKPLTPLAELKAGWIKIEAAGKWEEAQGVLREVFQ